MHFGTLDWIIVLATLTGAPPKVDLADWWLRWWEEWTERAAIREYSGGQCREHAEAEALAEIVARLRSPMMLTPVYGSTEADG